jgi:ATP-dependent helicase/nuclease subunit B
VTLEPVYDALFTRVAQDAWIITPNRRLARGIQRALGDWQLRQGHRAWAQRPVLAWQDFILQLWQQWLSRCNPEQVPAAARTLLREAQAQQLWLRHMREATADLALLQPDALAPLAYTAWQHLQAWRLPLQQLPDSTETALLQRCAAGVEAQMLAEGWLDPYELPGLLLQALASDGLQLPPQLVLTGFDDHTPEAQALLEALAQAGCPAITWEPSQRSQVWRQAVPSADDEILCAAHWAQAQFSQAQAEGRPLPRLALVIPDLPSRRESLERVLIDLFEPQYWQLQAPRHAPGFNLSVAQPLGETPLIAAALNLLHMAEEPFSPEALRQMLYSPFLGSPAELTWRCAFASDLLSRYPKPRWRYLLKQLERSDLGRQGQQGPWHQSLLAYLQSLRTAGRQPRLLSLWIAQFEEELRLWQWPGERHLDTLEYQQLAQWPVLLEDARGLDGFMGPVSRGQALACLQRLAYRPFAAQTMDSPLQVMGLLEAAGQQFDGTWVMQMNAHLWPPAIAPNPLLPAALQRQEAMPRASVARELRLAQQLTQRLAQSAPQVIFSFALRQQDQPLAPSPLIEAFTSLPPAPRPSPSGLAYRLFAPANLEPWQDDQGPALADTTADGWVRGGTQVIRDQAACEFRAFAKHRLGARLGQPAVTGISGSLRGNLVHRVLDDLWQQWQSQAALQDTDDAQLQAQLDAALANAWQALDSDQLQNPAQRQLESLRARQLVLALLQRDLERPPFEVVLQEQAAQLELGPLRLDLRFDRIDRLADGSHWVIDYKTRPVSPKVWLDTRPEDPQVPLYCLAVAPVSGALIGQLHPAEVDYLGLVEEGRQCGRLQTLADMPDPAPATWHALLQHWREVFQNLAEDFSQGRAATNPKQAALTCRYCDLAPLCRIAERRGGVNPSGDSSSDDSSAETSSAEDSTHAD